MRFIAALLVFFFPSCTHLVSHPVTGMFGRQCGQTRVVYCQQDLTLSDCAQVRLAVDYFNAATGLDLFRWGGYTVKSFPSGATTENLIVQYSAKRQHIAPGLALTAAITAQNIRWAQDGCITLQTILLLVYTEDLSPAIVQTMLRHELGHAAGLPDIKEAAPALMRSEGGADEEESGSLTEWDLNMLRAMYARVPGAAQ